MMLKLYYQHFTGIKGYTKKINTFHLVVVCNAYQSSQSSRPSQVWWRIVRQASGWGRSGLPPTSQSAVCDAIRSELPSSAPPTRQTENVRSEGTTRQFRRSPI